MGLIFIEENKTPLYASKNNTYIEIRQSTGGKDEPNKHI
jgi:hypothetical protein